MSSSTGSQNLLVNVFRPVYKYSADTGFVPSVELAGVGYSGNSIAVNTAAVGDSADNVYIGSNAGNSYLELKSSTSNTAVGYGAGALISNVSNSVYLGVNAGAVAFNASNVIAIGSGAGGNGISNIFIGGGTKGIGTNNILLGHGLDSSGSNYRLQIGSTIYGDLSTNWVGIGTSTPSSSGVQFDVSGTAASSNLVVSGYIRNAITSPQFEIAGGNISNVGTTTSSNFVGTYGATNSIGGTVLSNGDVRIPGILTAGGFDVGAISSSNLIVGGYLRNYATPSEFDISGGNISNSKTTTSSNFIGSLTASNSIGGVTLSNGNVIIPGTLTAAAFDISSGAISSSNLIVGGFLRNAVTPDQFDISGGNIRNVGTTTSSNFIGTAAASNSIGGIILSNGVAVAATIRDASTSWTMDMSAGAISNSGRHTAGTFTTTTSTTSNVIGGITLSNSVVVAPTLRNAATSWTIDMSGGAISNSGTHTASNFIGTAGASNSIGGSTLSNGYVRAGTAGTAPIPAISFVSDPSSGVYLPATGNVAIATGGSNRVSVLSNGNVGIGVTNPVAGLELSTTATIAAAVIYNNSTTATSARILDGYQPGISNLGKIQLLLGKNNNASNSAVVSYTHVADGSANNYIGMGKSTGDGLIVNQLGNVGLNTTTPSSRLTLNGSDAANSILLTNGSGNSATRAVTGGVVSNEISGLSSLGADAGQLRLSAGGGTNAVNKSYIDLYGYNTNTITLGTIGLPRVTVGATGRVGIGTTDPSEALQVMGNVQVGSSNTYQYTQYRAGVNSAYIYGSYNPTSEDGIDIAYNYYNIGGGTIIPATNTTSTRLKVAYNKIQFFTGSNNNTAPTERMVVTSNGLVGIGMTNPRWSLDVSSAAVSGGAMFYGSNATVRIGGPEFGTGDMGYQAGGIYSALHTWKINLGGYSAPANTYMFNSSGRLGIGTSNPQNRLDISSATASDGINITAPNANVTLKDPGNAYPLQMYSSTVGQGFYTQAARITISTNGVSGNNGLINSNNLIGIGTADPSQALTVAGNIMMGTFRTDYRQFILGGGNSYGYIYGAWAKYGEGIHMGFNFFNDNTTNVIHNTGLSTSRISTGNGYIGLYTGGVNQEPTTLGYLQNQAGNVGIGNPSPNYKLDVSGTIRGSSNIVAVATASNWVNTPTGITDTSLTIVYTPKQSGTVTLMVDANVEAYYSGGSGFDSIDISIRNNATVLTTLSTTWNGNAVDGRNGQNFFGGGRMATTTVTGATPINVRITRGGDDTLVVRNGYLRVMELSTV